MKLQDTCFKQFDDQIIKYSKQNDLSIYKKYFSEL